MFSSSWLTNFYRSYYENVHKVIVVVKVFCGAMLSKSGTQGLTFMRAGFSNVHLHAGKWHNVGLNPNQSSITAKIPDAKCRHMKF